MRGRIGPASPKMRSTVGRWLARLLNAPVAQSFDAYAAAPSHPQFEPERTEDWLSLSDEAVPACATSTLAPAIDAFDATNSGTVSSNGMSATISSAFPHGLIQKPS